MKVLGVPHQYACFVCRKSFKRPQLGVPHNHFMTAAQQQGQNQELVEFEKNREYKCPDCGGSTHYMATDFKAPKKSNVKAWAKAEAFIQSGKVYCRGSQDAQHG